MLLLVTFYLSMLSILVFHFVFDIMCHLLLTYWCLNTIETFLLCLAYANTGGFCNLHFISSKASCCSSSQTNCLPFLIKSYIGFNNLCNSGQNMLTKLTIPAKLFHCLAVVGAFIFCITSNLLHKGFTQTLLSFMNIVFPIYCNSVLNNCHFFREIFKPFFLNAFNKSSSLSIFAFLLGVKQ